MHSLGFAKSRVRDPANTFISTSEPRLVLGERQDGLVEVGGRLAVDGDSVGRRVRLQVAAQGPAQRTSASGDAGETTDLIPGRQVAKKISALNF